MSNRLSLAAGAMLAVVAVTEPAAVAAVATGSDVPTEICGSGSLDRSLIQHLRLHHFLDAHGLAQVFLSLCPTSPARFRWQLLDALALDQLDEPMRAQQALAEVAAVAATSSDRDVAGVLLARSHLLAGDQRAFAETVGRLPPPTAARLRLFALRDEGSAWKDEIDALNDPQLAAVVMKSMEPYQEAAHARRPWLAGTFSAVLPGAGQVYAGSWQGAAVAFILNAVLIGATAELAYHRLYAAAGATGLAASVFYVGNILNAADLAHRRNQQSALPHRESLERVLIPEAFP